jgi:hypothetical protein
MNHIVCWRSIRQDKNLATNGPYDNDYDEVKTAQLIAERQTIPHQVPAIGTDIKLRLYLG